MAKNQEKKIDKKPQTDDANLSADQKVEENPKKEKVRKSRRQKIELSVVTNYQRPKVAQLNSPSYNVPAIQDDSRLGEQSITKLIDDSQLIVDQHIPGDKESKYDERLFTLE